MINLQNCNFCVWGFKNYYDTFKHIHEAWYRTLKFKYPTRQVLWLDEGDNLNVSGIDFENTFFITMDKAVNGIPRRKDCFYAVHNIEQKSKSLLSEYPLMHYGLYVNSMNVSNWDKLATDSYYHDQPWEKYSAVVFRWATDLLPHEIQANKRPYTFNKDSKVINYVGSGIPELTPFARACEENGIKFNLHSRVSVEENIKLVRESYFAPAICLQYQNDVGYIPCRFFKNISYGMFPVTNNIGCAAITPSHLSIAHFDTHELFYAAKEGLPNVTAYEQHCLMNWVAEEHTYLNRLDVLLEAARRTQESRA